MFGLSYNIFKFSFTNDIQYIAPTQPVVANALTTEGGINLTTEDGTTLTQEGSFTWKVDGSNNYILDGEGNKIAVAI